MCRIAGIWLFDDNQGYSLEDTIVEMRDTMASGGPDDAGIYFDENEKIGFGHRRLSIIDLSSNGHQPMEYGKYVITFNGEIYNYKVIAKELKENGYVLTTDSDTEVILKAFDCWSYNCVHKFRGMFSFAIWDKENKRLTLCRDRVGVKPLYWYYKEDVFMFSSELKAFHKFENFDKTINQEAVSLFLQTGYIRSPYCIFKNAFKVEPGSFLEIDFNKNIKTWKYWDLLKLYSEINLIETSELDQIEQCERILKESFQLRMVADVPVGIFLSGGIDSSLVTALLQHQSNTPLKTFTIGFHEQDLNEANYAKKIAEYLGTDHSELYCTKEHFNEIINQLPIIYDEPFGDSSAIPTLLVSKLAKQHVKVSLSADAGDEIFGGYTKYLVATEYFNKIKKIPKIIKRIIEFILKITPVYILNVLLSFSSLKGRTIGNKDRYKKLANALSCDSVLEFLYKSSQITSAHQLMKIHNYEPTKIFDISIKGKSNMVCSMFGVADILSYLEGDILTKVDRATMCVSLEGREPFTDHKIIEFALSLPDNMKIRNNETKWILRQILYKYVPKDLIERPKMGFGIPIEQWLRDSLKPSISELSVDYDFITTFSLDSKELKRVVDNFLKCENDRNIYLIWYLHILHKWYETWLKK